MLSMILFGFLLGFVNYYSLSPTTPCVIGFFPFVVFLPVSNVGHVLRALRVRSMYLATLKRAEVMADSSLSSLPISMRKNPDDDGDHDPQQFQVLQVIRFSLFLSLSLSLPHSHFSIAS